MNKTIFYFIIILFGCSNQKIQEEYEIKKESGTYLIEINVNQHYYSRWDQIEEGNTMIKSVTKKSDLHKSYNECIYKIGLSRNLYELKMKLNKQGIIFDTESFKEMNKLVHGLTGDYSKGARDTLIDFGDHLTYLKFKATISYINIGKVKRLIPKFRNYKCCYSNVERSINTKWVLKMENFTIIKE